MVPGLLRLGCRGLSDVKFEFSDHIYPLGMGGKVFSSSDVVHNFVDARALDQRRSLRQ